MTGTRGVSGAVLARALAIGSLLAQPAHRVAARSRQSPSRTFWSRPLARQYSWTQWVGIGRGLVALLLVTVLLALSNSRVHAQSNPHAYWVTCAIHLDWATMRHITARQCWTVPMPREHRTPTGWTIKRTRLSPHVERSIRFPTFPGGTGSGFASPLSRTGPDDSCASVHITHGFCEVVHVTGYCLTGVMASGHPVYSGAVANNVLPFGTPVSVPSLGFHGSIEDRGDNTMGTTGLDIWSPSCAATYGLTGDRAVVIG